MKPNVPDFGANEWNVDEPVFKQEIVVDRNDYSTFSSQNDHVYNDQYNSQDYSEQVYSDHFSTREEQVQVEEVYVAPAVVIKNVMADDNPWA